MWFSKEDNFHEFVPQEYTITSIISDVSTLKTIINSNSCHSFIKQLRSKPIAYITSCNPPNEMLREFPFSFYKWEIGLGNVKQTAQGHRAGRWQSHALPLSIFRSIIGFHPKHRHELTPFYPTPQYVLCWVLNPRINCTNQRFCYA